MDLFITFNTKLVTDQKFYLSSTCNPTITMEWKKKQIGWKKETHKVPILTFLTSHNEITEYRQYDHNGRSNDLEKCYSLMKRLVTENIAIINLSEKYRYQPVLFNDFKKKTIYVSDTIQDEIEQSTLENYKMTKCSIEVETIGKIDKEPPLKKSKYY
jgi:hypothetical protein